MTRTKLTICLLIVLAATLLLMMPREVQSVPEATTPEPEVVLPVLSHAQEVWMHALEWCESSGNPNAVNAVDLDGTPSYGAFQFKPSTLEAYAKRYDIEWPMLERPGGEPVPMASIVMSRDFQIEVITEMVLHADEIPWHREFPWCIKKIGLPPQP